MKRQLALFLFAVVTFFVTATSADACPLRGRGGCNSAGCVVYTAAPEQIYSYYVYEVSSNGAQTLVGTRTFSTWYGWSAVTPLATTGTPAKTVTPAKTTGTTELPDSKSGTTPKYEGLPKPPRYFDLPKTDK